MTHNFACLIEARSIWETLSQDDFQNVVDHLIKSNHKKTVISGIFRQLYHEGDANDDKFYDDLLTISRTAQSQSQNKICTNQADATVNEISDDCEPQIHFINYFDFVPNDLFCNIASHLTAYDVFNNWNHVSRKFLQIGLKPESITSFSFTHKNYQHIEKYTPKFSLGVTLSKLMSIESFVDTSNGCNYEDYSIAHLIAGSYGIDAKHAKNIIVGMCIVQYK